MQWSSRLPPLSHGIHIRGQVEECGKPGPLPYSAFQRHLRENAATRFWCADGQNRPGGAGISPLQTQAARAWSSPWPCVPGLQADRAGAWRAKLAPCALAGKGGLNLRRNGSISCKLMETPESAPRVGSNCVGTWLSLVEHSLGVRGVGSSNLPVPTIFSLHGGVEAPLGRDLARRAIQNPDSIFGLD